ncbi:MAG TPA: DUF5615 family PIN-like protein [Caulobacteraceae bacterium]|jgi:hypothetical protein|nr:DUF5615 family PIN-like protein [Caulobacteraceae bacterium]
MAKLEETLRFFTDNNVPDSVGTYLRHRGHSVYRMRHHMRTDEPDPVVARAALEDDRILVSLDKDFNSQRFAQDRFAKLSRLALSGESPTLLPAIKKHMDLIEFQWGRCRKAGVRFVAHVRFDQIRFRD